MNYAIDFGFEQLRIVRSQIKDAIVNNAKEMYCSIHGDNPNFEEDEEYVLNWESISKVEYVRIPVDMYDSLIDDSYLEYHLVKAVKVALDDNLFFDLEDNETEVEWKDVSAEHLALICDLISESLSIAKA